LPGVCGAGAGGAAKGHLTEQIQSSTEHGKADFYCLFGKINPIVLSNLKVINKKFED